MGHPVCNHKVDMVISDYSRGLPRYFFRGDLFTKCREISTAHFKYIEDKNDSLFCNMIQFKKQIENKVET